MSKNEEFIRFCGQLAFGDGDGAWERLTESQREEYCAEARKAGWDLLFFSRLKERLPQPYRQDFKKRHQIETIKRLMEERDLADLYRLLEAEKIPFVPLKGADLAFRCYSDPALRPHGDWDILFRNEDCPKLFRLLMERGWRTPSGGFPNNPLHHHYEEMFNGRNGLEVHIELPNFGKATAEEIWQNTEEVTEFHRVLTPEMNLLLVAAHAGEDSYVRASDTKIMMDGAMILQHGSVDWDEAHRLADRWGILKPDVLLHVWDEFFPANALPDARPYGEQLELIRGIFQTLDVVRRHSHYERQMAAEKHDVRWARKVLNFYTKEWICQKYNLPADKTGKILLYGIRDFFGKALYFLTHSRKENPELRSYCKKLADLEKSVGGSLP